MGYIALLVTGLLYSCVTGDLEPKLSEPQEPEIQSQEHQIAEPDEPDGSVLRASFAGGRATKTDFGRFTTSESYAEIYWSENDSINVFYPVQSYAESCKYVTSQSGPVADFVNQSQVAPAGSSFLGLYPYTRSASADISRSTIQTILPSSQLAYPGRFDPTALLAVASSTSADEMAFYNVCSGLCFTLKDGGKYSRIDFRGGDGEKIAGTMSISLSDPASPLVSPVSQGAETKVELRPAEGDTFAAGTQYYIMIKPSELKNGFSLDFYTPGTNSATITCTCPSFILFSRGEIVRITEVDAPGKLARIRDGWDLAEDGKTANCYIVPKAGSYKFPLVMGNDPEHALSDISKVTVLWETDNTSASQTVGSIIKDVTNNSRYVYFNTPSTLKNGNAVIAAWRKVGGKDTIVWSWHIWVCKDFDPDASAQTLQRKPKPMMDRNLGALSNSATSPLSNGFVYQWGRKDPFPGAIESYVAADGGAGTYMSTTGGTLKLEPAVNSTRSVTVDYVIAHPDVFITSTEGYWLPSSINTLWGVESKYQGGQITEKIYKSLYDPCPPGWKVPRAHVMNGTQHVESQEAWSGLSSTEYRWEAYGRGIYLPTTQGEAWYPNNGYITKEGKVIMVGQYCCYWSCDPYGGGLSFAMQLLRDMGGRFLFNPIQYGKVNGEGHSVRCIKEN